MLDNQSKPIPNGSTVPPMKLENPPLSVLSLPLIFAGLIVGVVGLALVSNQYGNTDTFGLPVIGVGGTFLCTGTCSLFLKLRHSVIIGIIAAPASIFLLFVLYWVSIIAAVVVSW